MNRHLLQLSFFFIMLIFLYGCNKEKQESRLLSSLVGNYIMSGHTYEYPTVPPNITDTTIQINNDTISITKIDDSTLMVFGYYVFYQGINNNEYTFGAHQWSITSPTIELSFNTGNIKSVKLTDGGIGWDTELSGTKIP